MLKEHTLQNTDNTIKFQYLYPASLFATDEHYNLTTVLGSCVSVCLYDPVGRVSAMNHFMLPVNPNPSFDIKKYGDTSMGFMFEKLLALGAVKNKIEAKIFGGSEINNMGNSSFNIGKKNIEQAFHYLKEAKIPVVNYDVGGGLGRKIVFDTRTGIVKRKYINNTKVLL
ncbi:MAG: chemotaxis protein CheD [Bacteroidales bacterium]|jgi:chemotaxis protein CheD